MATIKELSYEAFLKTELPDSPWDSFEIGFKLGMKTAINEIEKFVNPVLEGKDYPEFAFDSIVDKIRELKGEL